MKTFLVLSFNDDLPGCFYSCNSSHEALEKYLEYVSDKDLSDVHKVQVFELVEEQHF